MGESAGEKVKTHNRVANTWSFVYIWGGIGAALYFDDGFFATVGKAIIWPALVAEHYFRSLGL